MSPYQRRLGCYDSGRWFMLPKEFLRVFTVHEAIALAAIINVVASRIKVEHHKEEWVKLGTPFLAKELTFSENKVDRLLQRFEKLAILQRKVLGLPAKRWVWIDVDVLDMWLDSDGEGLAKLQDLSITKLQALALSKWQEHYIGKNIKDKEHCLDCAETDWKVLGGQLRNAISEARLVTVNSTPYKWGEHLRRLHTTDKVAPSRIKEVLDWYCGVIEEEGDLISNGNPNFIPIGFSGSTFRGKFDKLIRCMNKQTKAKKAKGPTIKVRKIKISDKEADLIEENDPNNYRRDW